MDSREFEKVMKKVDSVMEGVLELKRRNELMTEFWNRMPREFHSQMLFSKDKEFVQLYLKLDNTLGSSY